MTFPADNRIVKLCVEGMEFEGMGENGKASERFEQAWSLSQSNFEKFTAAHYVARHQKSVAEKLIWDKLALDFALKVDKNTMNSALPSLYLNVGKCYEDLNDFESARTNYALGKSFFDSLPDDGYGNWVRMGIERGLERTNESN
jgi:rifampin ADP-ribosylating transferase